MAPLGIEVEKHLRSFWEESGFKIIKESRDGMIIERPDYWVVRVSVLDLSHTQYEKLLKLTERSQYKDLLGKHRTIAAYLKEGRGAAAMDESTPALEELGSLADRCDEAMAEALKAGDFDKQRDILQTRVAFTSFFLVRSLPTCREL